MLGFAYDDTLGTGSTVPECFTDWQPLPAKEPTLRRGSLSGQVFSARLFADNCATYVGLAAPFTVFVRVCQTRFLLFRFRDLRLNFLRVTASM